jgi:hypothetical protein
MNSWAWLHLIWNMNCTNCRKRTGQPDFPMFVYDVAYKANNNLYVHISHYIYTLMYTSFPTCNNQSLEYLPPTPRAPSSTTLGVRCVGHLRHGRLQGALWSWGRPSAVPRHRYTGVPARFRACRRDDRLKKSLGLSCLGVLGGKDAPLQKQKCFEVSPKSAWD